MVSFGVSATDIKEAVKVCNWLWVNCFDKNNSADIRYAAFGKSIRGLEGQLSDISDSVSTAIQTLNLGYDLPGCNGDGLRQEWKDVAGDFLMTIRECETILKNESYVHLKKNRAGFITNVSWALSVQDQVDKLCNRIQLHTDRLSFIMEGLQLDLLSQILRDIGELVERSRNRDDKIASHQRLSRSPKETTLQVPSWLLGVFHRNAALDPPFGFTVLEDVPLSQWCDTLFHHFRTCRSRNLDTLTANEVACLYLNLLKSQWIINTLRAGNHFFVHLPGSPLRRFISNVQQQIGAECARLEAAKLEVSEDALKSLQTEGVGPFLIWEQPVVETDGKRSTDPSPEEEKIHQVSLLAGGKLLLFRKSSSPTHIRILRVVEQEGRLQVPPSRGLFILDTRVDQFIPHYTIGGLCGQLGGQRVEIRDGRKSDEVVFVLSSEQDARDLQRAATGYRVVFDRKMVTLEAQRPFTKSIKPQIGRVQIWQWKPFTALPAAQGHVEHKPSTISISSGSFKRETEGPFSHTSTSRSVLPKSEPPFNRDDTQVLEPTPPAVVFFGRLGAECTYFHLELDYDHDIVPASCNCMKNSECRVLVIEKIRKPKRFYISRLSAHETNWNLSLFGGPGHPKEYYNKDVVKRVGCDVLKLVFENADLRREFTSRFRTYFDQYRAYYNDFLLALRRRKDLADRPRLTADNASSIDAMSMGSRPSSPGALKQGFRSSVIRLPY